MMAAMPVLTPSSKWVSPRFKPIFRHWAVKASRFIWALVAEAAQPRFAGEGILAIDGAEIAVAGGEADEATGPKHGLVRNDALDSALARRGPAEPEADIQGRCGVCVPTTVADEIMDLVAFACSHLPSDALRR
jgi:hypothetical protein